MKVLAYSKEELLDLALDMIEKRGMDCFTVRTFAMHADIAVGTIYNYFGGKEALLIDIVDAYWSKSIREKLPLSIGMEGVFFQWLEDLYGFVVERSKEFHRCFIGSKGTLHKDNQAVAELMMKFRLLMKEILLQRIQKEPKVESRILEMGTLDDFMEMLLDNTLARAAGHKEDLGIFLVVLKNTF